MRDRASRWIITEFIPHDMVNTIIGRDNAWTVSVRTPLPFTTMVDMSLKCQQWESAPGHVFVIVGGDRTVIIRDRFGAISRSTGDRSDDYSHHQESPIPIQ